MSKKALAEVHVEVRRENIYGYKGDMYHTWRKKKTLRWTRVRSGFINVAFYDFILPSLKRSFKMSASSCLSPKMISPFSITHQWNGPVHLFQKILRREDGIVMQIESSANGIFPCEKDEKRRVLVAVAFKVEGLYRQGWWFQQINSTTCSGKHRRISHNAASKGRQRFVCSDA